MHFFFSRSQSVSSFEKYTNCGCMIAAPVRLSARARSHVYHITWAFSQSISPMLLIANVFPFVSYTVLWIEFHSCLPRAYTKSNGIRNFRSLNLTWTVYVTSSSSMFKKRLCVSHNLHAIPTIYVSLLPYAVSARDIRCLNKNDTLFHTETNTNTSIPWEKKNIERAHELLRARSQFFHVDIQLKHHVERQFWEQQCRLKWNIVEK